MTSKFMVEKDGIFVKDFVNKLDEFRFAEAESLKNVKNEYCVVTEDKLLVASYRQGNLGIIADDMKQKN